LAVSVQQRLKEIGYMVFQKKIYFTLEVRIPEGDYRSKAPTSCSRKPLSKRRK
jgi:hypothetical protein